MRRCRSTLAIYWKYCLKHQFYLLPLSMFLLFLKAGKIRKKFFVVAKFDLWYNIDIEDFFQFLISFVLNQTKERYDVDPKGRRAGF